MQKLPNFSVGYFGHYVQKQIPNKRKHGEVPEPVSPGELGGVRLPSVPVLSEVSCCCAATVRMRRMPSHSMDLPVPRGTSILMLERGGERENKCMS